MTTAVTEWGWWLQTQLELVNIALLYLMPVLLITVWWGRWPSYFTAVVGVHQFDFLCSHLILDFSVYDIRYIWVLFIFLVVFILIGGRTGFGGKHEWQGNGKKGDAALTLAVNSGDRQFQGDRAKPSWYSGPEQQDAVRSFVE